MCNLFDGEPSGRPDPLGVIIPKLDALIAEDPAAKAAYDAGFWKSRAERWERIADILATALEEWLPINEGGRGRLALMLHRAMKAEL